LSRVLSCFYYLTLCDSNVTCIKNRPSFVSGSRWHDFISCEIPG